jgi:hypothetical protein
VAAILILGMVQYHREVAVGDQLRRDIGISSYLDIGGGRLALILFLVTLAC